MRKVSRWIFRPEALPFVSPAGRGPKNRALYFGLIPRPANCNEGVTVFWDLLEELDFKEGANPVWWRHLRVYGTPHYVTLVGVEWFSCCNDDYACVCDSSPRELLFRHLARALNAHRPYIDMRKQWETLYAISDEENRTGTPAASASPSESLRRDL